MSAEDLDPGIRQFVDQVKQAYAELTPEGPWSAPVARRIAEQVREPWRQGGPVMAETRELSVDTRQGPVRLRLYRPKPGPADAALIYLHGGGFTIFSLDTHDRVMRELAGRTGMVVIGVDYALSPEVRFPVALEQITDVVRWAARSAEDLGLRQPRLAIGGDSAGGNLAFATAISLRDAGEPGLLRGIVSAYGGFGVPISDDMAARYGGEGYILTREESVFFWNNYLEDPAQRSNPLACPPRADLQGLPPSFLAIAECDIGLEQNLLMRDRLKAAGVAVKAKIYEGATHSFLEAVSISAVAERAFQDMAQWLRKSVARSPEQVT